MAETIKTLNKIDYKDEKTGIRVQRDFKEMDDKIASLESTVAVVATTEQAGIVELATVEETQSGSSTTHAVTPAGVKALVDPINTRVTNNEARIDALISGGIQVAYKDYTLEENQDEMLEGALYKLPHNASDEFVALDPKTGQPLDPQPVPEVTDLKVTYLLVLIKNSEGTVSEVGREYLQGSLQGVVYADKPNTFTQTNTFNAGINASGSSTFENVSVTGSMTVTTGIDLAGASGSQVVANAGQVKEYVDSFIPEIRPSTDSGEIPANKFVLYYDAE